MVETEKLPQIGLLNLMPTASFSETEEHWRYALGTAVDIVPVRFDDDPRLNGRCASLLEEDYSPISEINHSLDAIVITGANLEKKPCSDPLPFDDISYISQLRDVIQWAESKTKLAIYSCLASHIALNELFEVPRIIEEKEKIFGVFCHDHIEEDDLTVGIKSLFKAPHSRWGRVPTDTLKDTDVEVLIEGFEPEWLLSKRERSNGISIFLQGHVEYPCEVLKQEYIRDKSMSQQLPINYFQEDNPINSPKCNWQEDSDILFRNIINVINLKK